MAGEQRQQTHEERTIAMKYTTGLPTAKFADLLIRLREEGVEGYPPSMGLRNALKAVLIYMRHNIPQAVIGEQLGVSQPTISRAIIISFPGNATRRLLNNLPRSCLNAPTGAWCSLTPALGSGGMTPLRGPGAPPVPGAPLRTGQHRVQSST